MTKKKKKSDMRRQFPWLFLSALLIFCLWMTYLYGVFYVPSLPREEIPPFLHNTAQNPLTDTIQIQTQTQPVKEPQTTEQPSPAPVVLPADTTPVSSAEAPVQEQTAVYSRRSGVYNILCAGKDDAAFNTDVLILISVDTENGSAAVVQIPRDTYLDGGKINAVWAKKRNAAKKNGISDADAKAMDALCIVLEETLCIQIDHWVLCGLTAFREAVDALGGVTVDVPCDMDYDDPEQNLSIHLKAGEQLLNGAQAEGLIRFRSDYIRGDLGRVDVQKLFLSALLEKGKNVSLIQLPALLKTASKHLSMSLSFSDLLFFAKSAQKLDMQKVTFLTVPGTDCRENGDSGAWYYVLSRQGTLETVNSYLNVYQTPVDTALFDRDSRLTNPARQVMMSYYRTHLSPAVSSAADIREDGVPIALMPDS